MVNSDSEKLSRLFALSENMKDLIRKTEHKPFILCGLAYLQVTGTFISDFHSHCLVQILIKFGLIRVTLETFYSLQ